MKNTFIRRLLLVLVALFLIVYVAYQVYQTVYSPITIEIARSYSAYDTIDIEATVIRDETVVDSSVNGYLYYVCEDGDRVAKNGTIAYIYASQKDAMDRQQISRLDAEIAALEETPTQGSAGMMSLELLGKQRRTLLSQLIEDGGKLSYHDLAAKRASLLALTNKWQVIVGKEKDFSGRIAALKQQREDLARSSGQVKGTVTSPIAGYFVSQVDGYENSLSYHKITAMTVADVQRIQSNTATVSGSSVGKIVGDYQWYFVCVLSAEEAGKLSVDQNLTILLPFVSSTAVPVTVAALNHDRDGNVAAAFRCSYMSDRLASIRREEVAIRVREYAGLYVRDAALRFNDAQEPGVYIRVGDTIYFRKVEVVYHDENGRFSVCKQRDEKDYLQLYDDVVVSGRGLYDGKIIH